MKISFSLFKQGWLPSFISFDLSTCVQFRIRTVAIEQAIDAIIPHMVVSTSSYEHRQAIAKKMKTHLADRLYDANVRMFAKSEPFGRTLALPTDIMIANKFFEVENKLILSTWQWSASSGFSVFTEEMSHRNYGYFPARPVYTSIVVSRKDLELAIQKWKRQGVLG